MHVPYMDECNLYLDELVLIEVIGNLEVPHGNNTHAITRHNFTGVINISKKKSEIGRKICVASFIYLRRDSSSEASSVTYCRQQH